MKIDMNKKDGGIIINWQIHTFSDNTDYLKQNNPTSEMDKTYIFTGIIKEDPTGRWRPGYHMRSSSIVNMDESTGKVETENTIYQLEGPPGDPYFDEDIGRAAAAIFY